MKRLKKYQIALFFILWLFSAADAQEVFTWQSCIEEARKNHPDLIVAEESIKQFEASKVISGNTFYPEINTSLSASRAKTTTSILGKKTSKTANSFSYGVTADQVLFDGAKTANNVKSASENIKAAQYNYKFISSEVRLRLRTAFISLMKEQELLKLTQEIFNIRRSNLELITLRYESGIEHRGALLAAKADLAQAEFEISQTKRALEVAQRELIKEMGKNKFSAIQVQGIFKVDEGMLKKPDFEVLVNKNPSVGKIIAEKNSAYFGIKAAQANFFPQLSAQAGASRSGVRFLPVNDQINAGVSLSFPLFEGRLRFAEVDQARSIYNQAQANERSIKDGILVSLEQTWAALQDAVETVAVQKKFLDAAVERAKISEAQYSLGLIQFDNWTIIEDDLVRTKKGFLDAEVNALLTEANWVQASATESLADGSTMN